MESEGDRYRSFSRRALIVLAAQGVMTAALAGRHYYLGVHASGKYKLQADENRLSLRLIAPLRGEILDRFGAMIAGNRQDYRILLVPEEAENIRQSLAQLSTHIDLAPHQIDRVITQARRQRGFVPITVVENLDWETFARINVESVHMPGVTPDAGVTRYYPDASLVSHVIGYVAAVSEADLDSDPVLRLPGFKIGKQGIEKAFDERLRGQGGSKRVEVNAYGRTIREIKPRQDPRAGEDVVLTRDLPHQRYNAERLGEESAAAVVMDIHNGDLYGYASTPSFDPNDFNAGISNERWDALLNNPKKPLVNKCIAGQYPPGSTFKMITAIAALEEGLVEPDEQFYCTSQHPFGRRVFHCWKRGGHGKVDVLKGIFQSCDVYFYNLAERLDVDQIAKYARMFGLGEAYDLEIPGQSSGLVPTREWKLRARGERWQGGETLNVSIGQGAVLATPLQLAVMTSRIANGGHAVIPHLVHAVGEDRLYARQDYAQLPLKPQTLPLIKEAMRRVTEPGGTALRGRLSGVDAKMAGKTGTAQVRRISREERASGVRENDEKPWIERDHSLFVGFAPVAAPRYAVAVVVEHGGEGSKKAAPIARDIMTRALELDPASKLPLVSDPLAAADLTRT